MVNRIRSVALVCTIVVSLGARSAIAQGRPQCPPAPRLEASTISVDTKVALDALNKVLAGLGIDINFRTTRDSILKDNPRADQVIIVLTMANMLCEMIWSESTLSGADKAMRFQAMMQDMLSRALGPAQVARTDGRKGSRYDGPNGMVTLASLRSSGMLLVAKNPTDFVLPEPQTGFLRDPPFYVTVANKYFVIVGSSRTQEEGIHLMNQFKVKAPQYDFALYEPYGSNSYYGIMMASWVPRELASKVLQLARRDVAPGAYIWACRSTGQSC